MGISSITYFTRRIYDSYQRNIDDDTMFHPLIRSNSMRSNRSYSTRSRRENDDLSQGSSISGSSTSTRRSRGNGSLYGTRSPRDIVSGYGGKKRRKTIKKKKKLIRKKRKSNKFI